MLKLAWKSQPTNHAKPTYKDLKLNEVPKKGHLGAAEHHAAEAARHDAKSAEHEAQAADKLR